MQNGIVGILFADGRESALTDISDEFFNEPPVKNTVFTMLSLDLAQKTKVVVG